MQRFRDKKTQFTLLSAFEKAGGAGSKDTVLPRTKSKRPRCALHLFKPERAAARWEIGRRDLHIVGEGNNVGSQQGLVPVENNSERAVRKARRYSRRAEAVQVIRVPYFDDDAVLNAGRVGGEHRQTCFNRRLSKAYFHLELARRGRSTSH